MAHPDPKRQGSEKDQRRHAGTTSEASDLGMQDKSQGKSGTASPERKAPEPGGLSAAEQLAIRQDYFRHRIARCPRDQAVLNVQDVTGFGERTNNLLVRCPLCGLSASVN